MENFQKWKELELRLVKNLTIDSTFEKNMSKEIQHWREVLKRLLIIIEFLAVQSLAFRGGSDNIYERNNGNFLKLVEAIGKFDPILSEHLRRINNNETQNKYLSKDIQNEVIAIIANVIQTKIVSMIKQAKYYSIIVDCTPDLSRKEQLTLIIRIVDQCEGKFDIKEFFLGFLVASDTTGKGLTDLVLERLVSLGLSINDCRGQGYDNGSNMKGKNIGMQAQIRQLEPRAFFVPCASHSANLVLSDSVQCSAQAIQFFDTVQSLYVFFSSSVSRWEILKKNVKVLTLKPLCTTRWESRIDALKPLILNLADIYEALVELTTDKDPATRHTAEVLGNKILKFDFICSLQIWYAVLDRINIFSKYLQSPAICLTSAVNMLHSTILFLSNLRTDEKFQDFVSQTRNIALQLDIPASFPSASTLRTRRKKPLFSYEGRDEVIVDQEYKFKIEFYFKILDQAIQSVTERFDQISEHNDNFKFLYEISSISSYTPDVLEEKCLKLEHYLSHNGKSDISGSELFDELKTFSTLNFPKLPAIETLNYIFNKKNRIIIS